MKKTQMITNNHRLSQIIINDHNQLQTIINENSQLRNAFLAQHFFQRLGIKGGKRRKLLSDEHNPWWEKVGTTVTRDWQKMISGVCPTRWATFSEVCPRRWATLNEGMGPATGGTKSKDRAAVDKIRVTSPYATPRSLL